MRKRWIQAAAIEPPDRHGWGELILGRVGSGLHIDLLIYTGVLAVGVALGAARMTRMHRLQIAQERARASALEAQVAEARLQALRMQLQPHFLFNALNTVSALTRRDPRAARDTLAQLSELLRQVLDAGDQTEQLLTRELAFIESYLSIERARFSERLDVRMRCDAEVADALVPTFILQPLVKNPFGTVWDAVTEPVS